jgi:ABC-type lipoprotein release transport system permease subunit
MVMLFAAFGRSYLPAWRAANVDAMALRSE